MNDAFAWILVIAVLIGAWFGMRVLMRRRLARIAETVVGAQFDAFMFEVLVNAARIDGRLEEAERNAIAAAMKESGSDAFGREVVDAGLESAMLSKDDLIAYLQENGAGFSNEQKHQLLKAVLSVAMADGKFNEREHDVYLEYIEAVGFEGQGAPQLFESIVKQAARGGLVT